MSMNDKEKADALLGLINGRMSHFRQTRDIELKVNLSLWTVIVVAGHFLHGKVPLHGLGWIGFGLVTALVVLSHLFFWMRPIQRSEDTDAHFIALYRAEVEKLIGVNFGLPETKTPGWLWIAFEVGITAVLLAGVAFVLSI